MAGNLFEVAILEHPTKEEADKGTTSKLVFGPKCVVARDEQGALVAALLDGDRPQVDMQRAQVLIRPFVVSSIQSTQADGAGRSPAQTAIKSLTSRTRPEPFTESFFSDPRGILNPSVTYTANALPGRSYSGAELLANSAVLLPGSLGR